MIGQAQARVRVSIWNERPTNRLILRATWGLQPLYLHGPSPVKTEGFLAGLLLWPGSWVHFAADSGARPTVHEWISLYALVSRSDDCELPTSHPLVHLSIIDREPSSRLDPWPHRVYGRPMAGLSLWQRPRRLVAVRGESKYGVFEASPWSEQEEEGAEE